MPRLIIANLDCEETYRRGTSRALPQPVLQRIAALGTLLGAFGGDDDLLCLPARLDVDPRVDVSGLPRPSLSSGNPANPDRQALLAWGQTDATFSLGSGVPTGDGNSLHEYLWRLPSAPVECARRANHRGFAADTAKRLGMPIHAREFRTLDAVTAHVATLEEGSRWVLKAPWSAAGRDRFLARGPALTDRDRQTISNLMALDGMVFFESWLDRVADFGVLGTVDHEECRVLGSHLTKVDHRGGLVSITLARNQPWMSTGHPEFDEDLRRVTDSVGRELLEMGYRGPFGIDAWLFRTGDCLGFQPLGEVNARLTFGFVARVLNERIAAPAGSFEYFTLRVAGNTDPPSREASPGSSITLLEDSAGPWAWAEYHQQPTDRSC